MNISSISLKIDRAIREHSLAGKGDTVVVAVSGGVDSVVLLHYLAVKADLGLSLLVVHLNHGLRGGESDGDEKFVRDLSGSYGVRFECRSSDVAALSREQGLSLEEAGRDSRYSFFSEVAKEIGADSVAIAHHLDDQAETVLLRLIRGSGPTGLRGMSHRSSDGLYIRPLLDISRAETEYYASHFGLEFRVDSSNSDSSFLRNRIRLELMPLLSGYNPGIALRLVDTASIMAADEAVIAGVVADRWQLVGANSEDGITLDVSAVSNDIAGMRFRLYRRSIEMLKGDLRRITYRHLQAIDFLLTQGPPNGTLNLPAGLRVWRAYGKITFTLRNDPEVPTGYVISIPAEGIYQLPTGKRVSVSICTGSDSHAIDKMEMVVDLEKFPFPWTVRTFRPGDRIVPYGMKGRKKVKDLFIDDKVSRCQRLSIPLFFSGEVLFWVAGLRRGGSDVSGSSNSRAARVQLLEIMQDAAILA